MSDSFNLSFTNAEHDLYTYLKGMKNASGFLKDCIKSHQSTGGNVPVIAEAGEITENQIKEIYYRIYGDIITVYGSEYQFIRVQQECSTDIYAVMQNRAKMVKTVCGNDQFLQDAVYDYAKEHLPVLARFM